MARLYPRLRCDLGHQIKSIYRFELVGRDQHILDVSTRLSSTSIDDPARRIRLSSGGSNAKMGHNVRPLPRQRSDQLGSEGRSSSSGLNGGMDATEIDQVDCSPSCSR